MTVPFFRKVISNKHENNNFRMDLYMFWVKGYAQEQGFEYGRYSF